MNWLVTKTKKTINNNNNMQKSSYYDGWGFSDRVKVIIKGKENDRNSFYKELKMTFPKEDISKSGNEVIEVFVYEKQIPIIKKMATVFKMKIAYKEGGKLEQIQVAKIILDQLGGQKKLVMFTGAYNFVAIKNGVTFRIKNRGVNFVQIVLNGKDLYDITFSKFFKTTLKKVSEFKDVYFDELIPLFEKNTGMYLKFEQGGNLPQGLSIADANPYIAGAKAVQGIAPSSVSALDQRIASRINPDPNRPVFFKTGGSVWEKNGFNQYPKKTPKEWDLVEWSLNGHTPSFKGKMYFQSGTGMMFIETEEGNIYKPQPSNKLFWR